MPLQTWTSKPGQARSSIVPRLLFSVWLGGSLIWIAYWSHFFFRYCDPGPTFACVLGGFLETVFYSLSEVVKLVFGPPALVLFLGFALCQLAKVCRRPDPETRGEAEGADALN